MNSGRVPAEWNESTREMIEAIRRLVIVVTATRGTSRDAGFRTAETVVVPNWGTGQILPGMSVNRKQNFTKF